MEETTATEADAGAIAPQGTVQELPAEADIAAKVAKLEEEKDNYRKAYLKEAEKNKTAPDPTEDERIARVVEEKLAQLRIADINKEQDTLLKQALKENKELKLAQLNKQTGPITSVGTHSESSAVQDTAITQEQLAFFKSKGWDDKKIEAYKRNLVKRP